MSDAASAHDALHEPLVPADVDLRGFPFTPIFRARLFGSSFHARATDAEWRVGVTLWLRSWDQVPSGTLPDDDIDLCRLAELGRDLKTWAKVRERALHGWIKCTDGRLHHPVVAEGVLEAWERRSAASRKGKAGASKRWSAGNATAIEDDGTGIARAMPDDSNRHGHVNGHGKGERNQTLAFGSHARASKPQGSEYTREFEDFWEAFPRSPNASKADAFKAWGQVADARPATVVMVMAAKSYARWLTDERARRKGGDVPVCHASTWLRGRRWESFAQAQPAATSTRPIEYTDERGWKKRLEILADKGVWLDYWGPPRGEPGHLCSEEFWSTHYHPKEAAA